MFGTNKFENSFGLDFSDLRLRMIQFKKRGNGLKLICFNEISIPPGNIIESEIKNFEVVLDLVNKLIKNPIGGKLINNQVVASLPERKTFTKVIEIPKIPEKEINGAVKWEIEQHIPLSIDEVYSDWQLLKTDEKKKICKLMVAVAPKSIVDSYTSILKSSKLVPIALETESLAICRSLINQKEESKNAFIIVDLGASRTSLIIYDRKAIQYTATLEISGNSMTEMISKKLNLSFEQAEKAKIICGLDEKMGKGVVKNILMPTILELTKKIQEAINFYISHLPEGNPIKTVVLSGGVGQMKKLNAIIANNLKLEVIIGNPFLNVPKLKLIDKFNKDKYLPFTTAIGLALKNYLR